MFTKQKSKTLVVEHIIDEIAKNTSNFKAAFFDQIRLNDKEVEQLAKALEKNTYLTYISLLDCSLNEKKIGELVPAFEKNFSLTGIGIERFKNDNANITTMIDKIENCIERNKKFTSNLKAK